MATHIREVSDLHLEHFYDLYDKGGDQVKAHVKQLIPVLPTDKKTILIVAGDLATARRPNRIATFFELVVPRFKHVIYVFGNHEHYGMKISDTFDTIFSTLRSEHVKIDMSKLTVIGNDPVKVKIGDITFIGATLWTDYNKGDVKTSRIVQRYIRDHTAITSANSSLPFSTEEAGKIHASTLDIFEEWLIDLKDEKVVVVTHHMPSYSACDPQYQKDEPAITLNAAFASTLDAFILKHQPVLWFFGHTHTPYSGKIGKTELACNPLGYPGEANLITGNFNTLKVYSI
jgi:predicted phosphodiesterase